MPTKSTIPDGAGHGRRRPLYPGPPWELRRLWQRLPAHAIDLRPPQGHAYREETGPGDATAMHYSAAAEDTFAWWHQRGTRWRHYLRRAVTGRVPPHPRQMRSDRLTDEGRADMARFALLLSAIVLKESGGHDAGQRRQRTRIRRRLARFSRLEGASPTLSRIAGHLARKRLHAAKHDASGELEMALIEDAGMDWVEAGLGRTLLLDGGPSHALPPLEKAIAVLLRRGFAATVPGREARHWLVFKHTQESDVAYGRALFRERAMNVLPELPTGDLRRVALLVGVVGLIILSRREPPPWRWSALDPRHLAAIESLRDAPDGLRALATELLRFPDAAVREETVRGYWAIVDAIGSSPGDGPLPVPTAGRTGPASAVKAPSMKLPGEELGCEELHAESDGAPPSPRYAVLDIAAHGRRVTLDGAPCRYTSGKVQKCLTVGHAGFLLLLAHLIGGRVRVVSASARTQVLEAIRTASRRTIVLRPKFERWARPPLTLGPALASAANALLRAPTR